MIESNWKLDVIFIENRKYAVKYFQFICGEKVDRNKKKNVQHKGNIWETDIEKWNSKNQLITYNMFTGYRLKSIFLQLVWFLFLCRSVSQ